MSWQLKTVFKLFLCLWAEGRVNCFPPFSGSEHLWISSVNALILHSSNVCVCAVGRHGQCLWWCHCPMGTSLERFSYLSRKYLKQLCHSQVFSPVLEEPQNERFASVKRHSALCISKACHSFSMFLTAFSFTLKWHVTHCARASILSSVPDFMQSGKYLVVLAVPSDSFFSPYAGKGGSVAQTSDGCCGSLSWCALWAACG